MTRIDKFIDPSQIVQGITQIQEPEQHDIVLVSLQLSWEQSLYYSGTFDGKGLASPHERVSKTTLYSPLEK